MSKYVVRDNRQVKAISGPDFNMFFDKKTGLTAIWGATQEENPPFCPIGPVIADIEVTTSCVGVPNLDGEVKPCSFCYKGNTPNGQYMSFETFKKLFSKLPKTLTQIAFGADSTCSSNPDIWKIMSFCRENDVVPNITVANISDKTADNLVKFVGAVAVSKYENKNVCYDSVKRLTDRGLEQVNIHFMLHSGSFDAALETLNDIKNDPRLAKLNAIVFLSLKRKGRGVGFEPLAFEKFKIITDTALEMGIKFGFDSCSANKFLKAIKGRDDFDHLEMMVDPCESTLYSGYWDVNGDFFPCSFCEKVSGWVNGISMDEYNDFSELWMHARVKRFREYLLSNHRNCPIYEI